MMKRHRIKRYKDVTFDQKYFLSMRRRVICLLQDAHLISYVPLPSCRHISFPLLSTCSFFTPSYREERGREFVLGITMNRDCQPANCDITPPSGSHRTVSGGRGADAEERERRRIGWGLWWWWMGRKMKFRGETARQIPFTYVRAHMARARKVLRERQKERKGEREKETDRWRAYTSTFTCRCHHPGEFTRGINYVRTVKLISSRTS